MTNEQIEQAVREVVEQDASPRKVQALMRAVERFGPEWLETYQQRQQRQPTAVRQRTTRQRSTLDWADVEAWVKRQPQTSENWVVGGYYTTCPVPTHKTDDLISVWSGKDGGLGLKCWGSCTYPAIHEALADAIKTGTPSVTEPPATVEARIRELTEALDATKADRDQERAAREELTAEKADLTKQLTATKADAQRHRDRRVELGGVNSGLEYQLTTTKAQRDRERAARIAAEDRLRQLEAEQVSPGQRPIAAKAEQEQERTARVAAEGQARQEAQRRADMEKQLATTKAALDRERAVRNAAESRAQELQGEKSRLVNSLSAVTDRRDQFKRERDSAKGKLSRREKKISDLQDENSRLKKTRSAARFRGFDELAAAIASTKTEPDQDGNGRLSNAWRLFNKDEPTYAFVEGVRVLENDLRHLLRPKNREESELSIMLMNACQLELISQEQRDRLHSMRRDRNSILHESHQLTEPQTRSDLAYLKRVIGLLRPVGAGSQDGRGTIHSAGRPRIGGIIG